MLNRNQRAGITRIRTSAHTLGVEQGRYTKPVTQSVTPLNERFCKFCCAHQDQDSDKESCIDDEFHFLMICKVFNTKRNCLFGRVSAFDKHFSSLTAYQKMATLLCPSNINIAKLVNKFISIVFEARKRIEKGESMDLGYFTNNLNNSALSDSSNDS